MGTVVVSIDAELGWGFHDLAPVKQPAMRIERSRQAWLTLIDLLESADIAATWAVVGHLFEASCDGRHEGYPAPEGWFDHERDADPMPERFRCGPELVQRLADGSVDHDVGSHSYSHVEFDADYATEALARAECRRATEVAAEYGLTMESFVYPRNSVGHREVIADAGFSCYRSAAPHRRTPSLLPRALQRVARATVVDTPPPLVSPSLDEYGLVEIPASMFLFTFEGLARRMAEQTVGDPIVKQARLGVDAAADSEDGVFHLWLHPNNVVTSADIDRVDAIFQYIDHVRETTDMTVETMADVADRVRNTERPVQSTG